MKHLDGKAAGSGKVESVGSVHVRWLTGSETVLPQARTEALLADALAVLGVVPERGTALGSFEQDSDGVDAVLISADRSESFRAPIMFAADGAHSKVREALGITLEVPASRKTGRSTTSNSTIHSIPKVPMSALWRAAWCSCFALSPASGGCLAISQSY